MGLRTWVTGVPASSLILNQLIFASVSPFAKNKRLIAATLMIENEMEKNGVQTSTDTEKKRNSKN